MEAVQQPVPKSRRKFWTPKRKEALIGWLFLAPEIVGIFAIKRVCSWIFFVFKFIRLGYAVRRQGIEFTGFDNYIKMFHDPTIIQAIKTI